MKAGHRPPPPRLATLPYVIAPEVKADLQTALNYVGRAVDQVRLLALDDSTLPTMRAELHAWLLMLDAAQDLLVPLVIAAGRQR